MGAISRPAMVRQAHQPAHNMALTGLSVNHAIFYCNKADTLSPRRNFDMATHDGLSGF
jgi:hypothetical protein